MWKQWVNVLLGILIILFAYMGTGVTWMIIAGLLVAVLALWAALEKKGGPAGGAKM